MPVPHFDMHDLLDAVMENTQAVKDLLCHLGKEDVERCERDDCEQAIFSLLLAQSTSLVKRFRKLDQLNPPAPTQPN